MRTRGVVGVARAPPVPPPPPPTSLEGRSTPVGDFRSPAPDGSEPPAGGRPRKVELAPPASLGDFARPASSAPATASAPGRDGSSALLSLSGFPCLETSGVPWTCVLAVSGVGAGCGVGEGVAVASASARAGSVPGSAVVLASAPGLFPSGLDATGRFTDVQATLDASRATRRSEGVRRMWLSPIPIRLGLGVPFDYTRADPFRGHLLGDRACISLDALRDSG
jgi:hypothetical protein